MSWRLDYAPRLAAFQLDDAEALRIGDLLEQEPRAARLLAKRVDAGPQRILEDVVAEDDAHQVFGGEVLRQRKRLRDSSRLVLHLVREPAAELAPRSEQRDDVPHVL